MNKKILIKKNKITKNNEYIEKIINKKKIVICCVIRNCESTLFKIFNNINRLLQIFDIIGIIFSTDNNTDDTIGILQKYKQKNINILNIDIIINHDNISPYRTHRIALARNSCLKILDLKYPDTELHIMMDGDKVCQNKINIDNIKKYLDNENWDCLTFNRPIYYDIWALHYDNFIHNCWEWNGNSKKLINYIKKDIKKKLNNLKNDELFECYSAFNGFGIYRTKKFKNIKYNGENKKYFNQQEIDKMKKKIEEIFDLNENELKLENNIINQNCEHISYHINAIKLNNAKIRISKYYIF